MDDNSLCKFCDPERFSFRGGGGSPLSDFQDLSTPQEKRLGALVREKHRTDFWVLERFPMEVRQGWSRSATPSRWHQESCRGRLARGWADG